MNINELQSKINSWVSVIPDNCRIVDQETGRCLTIGREGQKADIFFKNNVNLNYLKPEILKQLPIVAKIWRENKLGVPVITSANDGKHKIGSKHYQNLAIDIRVNNISLEKAYHLEQALQEKLGDNYDVILETFKNQPSRNHIHLEYDPKIKTKNNNNATIVN